MITPVKLFLFQFCTYSLYCLFIEPWTFYHGHVHVFFLCLVTCMHIVHMTYEVFLYLYLSLFCLCFILFVLVYNGYTFAESGDSIRYFPYHQARQYSHKIRLTKWLKMLITPYLKTWNAFPVLIVVVKSNIVVYPHPWISSL